MTHHEHKDENKGEECCSTKKSCCCCGGKLVTSILLAILLFGAGYVVGKGGLCGKSKVCPIAPHMQHEQVQK